MFKILFESKKSLNKIIIHILYLFSFLYFIADKPIPKCKGKKKEPCYTSKCYKIGKLPKIHSRTYFPVKQDSYEFSKYLRGTKSRNEEG